MSSKNTVLVRSLISCVLFSTEQNSGAVSDHCGPWPAYKTNCKKWKLQGRLILYAHTAHKIIIILYYYILALIDGWDKGVSAPVGGHATSTWSHGTPSIGHDAKRLICSQIQHTFINDVQLVCLLQKWQTKSDNGYPYLCSEAQSYCPAVGCCKCCCI